LMGTAGVLGVLGATAAGATAAPAIAAGLAAVGTYKLAETAVNYFNGWGASAVGRKYEQWFGVNPEEIMTKTMRAIKLFDLDPKRVSKLSEKDHKKLMHIYDAANQTPSAIEKYTKYARRMAGKKDGSVDKVKEFFNGIKKSILGESAKKSIEKKLNKLSSTNGITPEYMKGFQTAATSFGFNADQMTMFTDNAQKKIVKLYQIKSRGKSSGLMNNDKFNLIANKILSNSKIAMEKQWGNETVDGTGSGDIQMSYTGFYWPANSHTITSPFGDRSKYIINGSKWHKGIDIHGNVGDPIYAITDGKVTDVGGKYAIIEITHKGNLKSRYLHCHSVNVKRGMIVKAGSKIGTIGKTATDVSHLHFDLQLKGKYINPITYMKKVMPGIKLSYNFGQGPKVEQARIQASRNLVVDESGNIVKDKALYNSIKPIKASLVTPTLASVGAGAIKVFSKVKDKVVKVIKDHTGSGDTTKTYQKAKEFTIEKSKELKTMVLKNTQAYINNMTPDNKAKLTKIVNTLRWDENAKKKYGTKSNMALTLATNLKDKFVNKATVIGGKLKKKITNSYDEVMSRKTAEDWSADIVGNMSSSISNNPMAVMMNPSLAFNGIKEDTLYNRFLSEGGELSREAFDAVIKRVPTSIRDGFNEGGEQAKKAASYLKKNGMNVWNNIKSNGSNVLTKVKSFMTDEEAIKRREEDKATALKVIELLTTISDNLKPDKIAAPTINQTKITNMKNVSTTTTNRGGDTTQTNIHTGGGQSSKPSMLHEALN